jgi:hypothetical protein
MDTLTRAKKKRDDAFKAFSNLPPHFSTIRGPREVENGSIERALNVAKNQDALLVEAILSKIDQSDIYLSHAAIRTLQIFGCDAGRLRQLTKRGLAHPNVDLRNEFRGIFLGGR